MTYSNFIDVNYIKTNTVIAGNVDAEEIKPFIIQSQDTYTQEVLGTRLYYELMNDVHIVYNPTNGTGSLSGNNVTLLNYIKPVVAYYALYLALPFTMVKFKAKGLLKGANNEVGSTSADLLEMKYLRENVLTTAQFYSDRLKTYLCNYNELYASYNNQGANPDISPIFNNNLGFFTGAGGISTDERRILNKYLGEN